MKIRLGNLQQKPVPAVPNRLAPMRFVPACGVVGMLADSVYEGAALSAARTRIRPRWASATVVGFVTGFGEAVAPVCRLFTGRISDRTGRHWALSISGYAMTALAVPLTAPVRCAAARGR